MWCKILLMIKEITFDEYTSYFKQIKDIKIKEVFKGEGPSLYFIFDNNFTMVVEGLWTYEEDEFYFSSNFLNDHETNTELYQRIKNFVKNDLNKQISFIKNINLDENKASITFDSNQILRVNKNKMGLISLSNKKESYSVFINDSNKTVIEKEGR